MDRPSHLTIKYRDSYLRWEYRAHADNGSNVNGGDAKAQTERISGYSYIQQSLRFGVQIPLCVLEQAGVEMALKLLSSLTLSADSSSLFYNSLERNKK